MSAYGPLAQWYDALTGDVPYEAFADFYERTLNRKGSQHLTLLDLCCGTGTLTCMLAARGHELIGTDQSAEMLAMAQEKAAGQNLRIPPLFLCQSAEELDLYGTVEGAFSALDSVNYIPPEDLPEVFRRLHLFIEPGGVLAFDLHSPQHLRELDGEIFVDETDDVLCLWRADFDETENALFYGMDLFRAEGALWRREQEEHAEYAHDPERLCALLRKNGFSDIAVITDGIQSDMGRLFITAVNLPH